MQVFEGEALEQLERSIMTPDRSAGQELLSSGAESTGFEDVSRVAATLYLEMKKCVKARNLQTFNEAITIVNGMLSQGKLPCTSAKLMAVIADHRDSEGRNLLHEAALAIHEGEIRFFSTLIKL